MAISDPEQSKNKEDELFSKDIKLDKRRILLSKLKRKVLKYTWILRILVVLLSIFVLYLIIIFSSFVFKKTGLDFYARLVSDFILAPEEKVKSINDHTNFILLGKGGKGHEAPDLTDTIVFVSVDHKDDNITLISLPRDIWITDLRTKLNSIYYWGNQKESNGGLILSKATIEEILGQPIHYAVVLDFSGFKEIIDVIGGIEVNVETTFKDEKYPIAGRENDLCGGDTDYKCRYETISFQQGKQIMSGDVALKFVRSRNAIGDEGTDFARQKRQQKIIKAIYDKIFSKEILLSPKKLSELKKVILNSCETDMSAENLAVLARRFIESRKNISSFVLPEEYLTNPQKSTKYDNLYVFIPKDGNWKKVHNWSNCIMERQCN